jgi:hypothetical protein
MQAVLPAISDSKPTATADATQTIANWAISKRVKSVDVRPEVEFKNSYITTIATAEMSKRCRNKQWLCRWWHPTGISRVNNGCTTPAECDRKEDLEDNYGFRARPYADSAFAEELGRRSTHFRDCQRG